MRQAALLAVVAVLSACGTTGRIGDLPAVASTDEAVKVVTIRISAFRGGGNNVTIALDGKDVFRVGSGEHAEFLVTNGEHIISVKCFGGWSPTWKEDSVRFNASSGTTSYFKIETGLSCASISQVAKAEADKLLTGSKALNLSERVQ